MFRVVGKFNEGFGNRTEKKIVHDLPVYLYQEIQFRGNGEVHMKIFNRQKIFTAGLDGAHDPQMIAEQLMGFSVNRAVLTKNVRNLKDRGCSHPAYEIG
jgi:hypothetical protein